MTIPGLRLTTLSELLPRRDAGAIMRELASRGCAVTTDGLAWSPVAGGGEYSRPEIDHVSVEGIDCRLIVEIYRMAEEPSGGWIDAIELFPADGSGNSWLAAMRTALELEFELTATNADGVTIYQRGAEEEIICFPPNGIVPPHLLVHAHPQLRTGA